MKTIPPNTSQLLKILNYWRGNPAEANPLARDASTLLDIEDHPDMQNSKSYLFSVTERTLLLPAFNPNNKVSMQITKAEGQYAHQEDEDTGKSQRMLKLPYGLHHDTTLEPHVAFTGEYVPPAPSATQTQARRLRRGQASSSMPEQTVVITPSTGGRGSVPVGIPVAGKKRTASASVGSSAGEDNDFEAALSLYKPVRKPAEGIKRKKMVKGAARETLIKGGPPKGTLPLKTDDLPSSSYPSLPTNLPPSPHKQLPPSTTKSPSLPAISTPFYHSYHYPLPLAS